MTHLLRLGRLEVETDLLLGAEEVLLPRDWQSMVASTSRSSTATTDSQVVSSRAVPTGRTEQRAAEKPPSAPIPRGFDAALFEAKPAARRVDEPNPIAARATEGPHGAPSGKITESVTGSITGIFTGNLTGNISGNSASSSGTSLAGIIDAIVPPAGASNAERLESLRLAHAAQCPHCTTTKGYTNLVFGEGNPDAELVFVGEAPGESEDLVGRPFVGKAGEKLDEMIRAMGLSRDAVYIANVLKARPPENRTPLAHEMERCGPYLFAQLSIIRPKAIVTLGGPATKLLLQSELGITRLRGVMREVTLGTAAGEPFTVPVMPTFHPAYLLRNYTVEVRKQMWEDLKQVLTALGRTPPSRG